MYILLYLQVLGVKDSSGRYFLYFMIFGIQVVGNEGGWRGGVCDIFFWMEGVVYGSIYWGEKEGRYIVCMVNKQIERERERWYIMCIQIVKLDCKIKDIFKIYKQKIIK